MFRTKAQRLAEILEATPELEVPVSAIRHMRGDRPQTQISTKTGLSQGYISDLESGKKALTPETAARLAPTLGVTPGELEFAEQVSTLQRLAVKGRLDPTRLLDAIQELAVSLPDGEVSDDLVDALLTVLKKALTTYEKNGVATKSARREGTRDSLGRRRNKPNQPEGGR